MTTYDKTISGLCQRSHEIAKEKGWLEKPRTFASITNLIKSELAEVLEDWRRNHELTEIWYELTEKVYGDLSGELVMTRYSLADKEARLLSDDAVYTVISAKPCGIPSELADVIIRICEYCGTERLDLEKEMALFEEACAGQDVEVPEDPDVFLANVNLTISMAYALTLKSLLPLDGAIVGAFAGAVTMVFDFCTLKKIDIWAAIEEKEAYNRKREYRHGGKRC